MEEWNRAALVSLEGELKRKVMLKTGLVDSLQKAAGGFMDEREALQWKVGQVHAEQMGDLVLIPLSNQQSGHSWSVLSLHGA